MNWPQLQTILWLRWRLTRNQWAKSGGLGAVIAAVVAVGAVVLSLVGLGLGFVIGYTPLSPQAVTLFWLGLTVAFLFFWMIGLISELQRSETIDIPRLLHLPVLIGQIFVVNYVASLAAISVVLYSSAAVGMSIGFAFSRGPRMLLMIPLALSMVFMISAWTYLLRGWLATLMSNPRRRRAIVMGLTAALILIAQGPNIYFNVIRRESRADRQARRSESREQREARDEQEMNQLRSMLGWQIAVPPLWVSAGAGPLAEGRPFPALLGLIGCAGIGALGLRRAYTSTLRFYTGDTGGRASAIAKTAPGAASASAKPRAPGGVRDRTAFVERQLPRVPNEAAAVGLATLQAMLRAPEIKMQWGSSIVVTLLVGAPLLFRNAGEVSASAGPFIATGVVVFSMFMMVGLVANQFGFDRDGFRAFVLSPVDRWKILFGKNLAAFPAAAASAAILVTIVSVFLRLSPLAYLAGLLQLVVGVLCASMAGNVMSILVPYRVQPGSMKPTKMPGMAMVLFIVCQLALPAALTPAFIPPLAGFLLERFGYAPAAPVNFVLSLVFASLMAMVYWATLAPTGRLLQRREMKILQTVSENVE